jgi:hypothetical protein
MKTPVQEIIDLLSIDEKLFDKTPYLIDILKEVYLAKEKAMIINVYNQGHVDREKDIFNVSQFVN